MRAALLCPGPSLPLYPGRDGFGLLIAVNRAATFAACDWWSIGDSETFADTPLDYAPAIWTHAEAVRRLRRDHPERFARHRFDTYDRTESLGWPLFSATAALMLAAKLGAKSVACYGCDMGGGTDADWDGVRKDRNRRDESRWAIERRIWAETVAGLKRQGIEVVRILP